MTSFKTIAVTAIIAVAGTMAAFGGLHLGQSNAAASTAQAAKAKVNYTVTLSAKQLATLMHGQQQSATHHVRAAHHQRQATHRTSGYRSTGRSYSRSGRSYSNVGSRGSYRCYNYGRSGGNWGSGSSGSRSGGGWGGGCW